MTVVIRLQGTENQSGVQPGAETLHTGLHRRMTFSYPDYHRRPRNYTGVHRLPRCGARVAGYAAASLSPLMEFGECQTPLSKRNEVTFATTAGGELHPAPKVFFWYTLIIRASVLKVNDGHHLTYMTIR